MSASPMTAPRASTRPAAASGETSRVRLVFEGRQRGCRALAQLLRERGVGRLEVELVALASPRVPGGVRLRLGGAPATDMVIAAANGALDEMGAALAREGIAYRTRVEVGTLSHALRAALREDEVDLCVVATGWPRWRVAWLMRHGRAGVPADRMIVA